MGLLSGIYPLRLIVLLLAVPFATAAGGQTPVMTTRATSVPLVLPGGLAYDARGNLYFAETGSHVVRRVDTAGVLTTVAGTGVQGFAGDGGMATAAVLDSPMGVALDAAGNLYIADTHNQRIRRVDAESGSIATVAGRGQAGFSGDGGAATDAAMNLPTALALDAGGDLYVADTGNHRIRRIDGVTGVIATVVGDGTEGDTGDGGVGSAASIDSPKGLAVDRGGNLYLSDTHNHRLRRLDATTGIVTTVGDGTGLALPQGLVVDEAGNLYVTDAGQHRIRRVDHASGQVTTVAGDGTEGFSGDGGVATGASLDTPRAVTLSGGGFLTLADSGNARVRQVDGSGVITTVAGLGTTTAGMLTLTGPSVVGYGTGSVVATLGGAAGTDSVTFFDTAGGTTVTLATVALDANAASFATGQLGAGEHRLSATYPGDQVRSGAQSGVLAMMVSPAAATAAAAAVSAVYGAAIPALTGTVTGLLAQDNGAVGVSFHSTAGVLSAPGAYPITAALSGAAAGNYVLSFVPAVLTIGRAPSSAVLVSPLGSTVPVGTGTLSLHLASTTAGVPTGSASLMDGAQTVATAVLSNAGDASFSTSGLAAGIHTLTVVYPGDGNFLGSVSAPLVVDILAAATPSSDFSLAVNGQATAAVTAGSAASFAFNVTPVGAALSSSVLLSASGLPPGATASFSPAYLPPGSLPTGFVLTVFTPVASLAGGAGVTLAWVLPLAVLLLGVRSRRRAVWLAVAAIGLAGCADRVLSSGSNAGTPAAKTYVVTVSATGTDGSGAALLHTATVTLTLR